MEDIRGLRYGERYLRLMNLLASFQHPAIQLVECRYLYAFRESGSIFQPIFLAPRDDIASEECTTAQLEYRAEPKEQAA
jgi:hypothetical protein